MNTLHRSRSEYMNSSVKVPALTSHVIEIHTPVLSTSPTKSPPSPHQAGEKDKHLPPLYTPQMDEQLPPSTETKMPEIIVTSPNKPPHDKRVSVQDVLRPPEETAASGNEYMDAIEDSQHSTVGGEGEDELRGYAPPVNEGTGKHACM